MVLSLWILLKFLSTLKHAWARCRCDISQALAVSRSPASAWVYFNVLCGFFCIKINECPFSCISHVSVPSQTNLLKNKNRNAVTEWATSILFYYYSICSVNVCISCNVIIEISKHILTLMKTRCVSVMNDQLCAASIITYSTIV